MKKLFAGAAIACLIAGSAQAATLYQFTGAGGDGAVNATALVDVTATTLTVDLTNLLASPTSIGQEISGIQFFFNTLPATSTLTTASGTEINIAKGGATSGSDNVIGHWGTAISGGSLFLATAGTGAAGGQPFDLIIGPGPYTNANSSITGKNPQIDQTGHFVLTFTGLSVAPTISAVNIAFGTSAEYHGAPCVRDCGGGGGGSGGGVPEPATWAMMIMGFGGVGALMRRRRTVFG